MPKNIAIYKNWYNEHEESLSGMYEKPLWSVIIPFCNICLMCKEHEQVTPNLKKMPSVFLSSTRGTRRSPHKLGKIDQLHPNDSQDCYSEGFMKSIQKQEPIYISFMQCITMLQSKQVFLLFMKITSNNFMKSCLEI